MVKMLLMALRFFLLGIRRPCLRGPALPGLASLPPPPNFGGRGGPAGVARRPLFCAIPRGARARAAAASAVVADDDAAAAQSSSSPQPLPLIVRAPRLPTVEEWGNVAVLVGKRVGAGWGGQRSATIFVLWSHH